MASNDPLAKPVIRGNYLTDPLDVATLVEGIQIALSFGNTTAMAKYNMTLSNHPLEACSRHPFLSNDYWSCAVRQDTGPENHQAGSCKMGPSSDPMAVVDPRLRVHGIRGLRVADTSIMPQVFIVLLFLWPSAMTNLVRGEFSFSSSFFFFFFEKEVKNLHSSKREYRVETKIATKQHVCIENFYFYYFRVL